MNGPGSATKANLNDVNASMVRDAAHIGSQVAGMNMNMNTPAKGLNVPGLKHKGHTRPSNYLPFVAKGLRGTAVAWIGEFLGTFLFLFFAFAGTEVANMTVARSSGTDAGPSAAALLYIALSFGMSLAVNVWAFFRVTGGMFNPAVS